MQKLFILLMLVLFIGCDPLPQDGEVEKEGYNTPVYKFKYKGHDYIQFSNGNGAWGTHNPSCECQSPKQ